MNDVITLLPHLLTIHCTFRLVMSHTQHTGCKHYSYKCKKQMKSPCRHTFHHCLLSCLPSPHSRPLSTAQPADRFYSLPLTMGVPPLNASQQSIIDHDELLPLHAGNLGCSKLTFSSTKDYMMLFHGCITSMTISVICIEMIKDQFNMDVSHTAA